MKKLKMLWFNFCRSFGIWLLKQEHDAQFIMSGTMEEVHRDADGIAYALQNSVYMEGELRTVREMFCNLFIEREDFFDDVIAPALRMVTDKKRIVISVDEPQKKEKKPKRTVN